MKLIRSPRLRWFIAGCIVTSMFRISFSPNNNKDYELHEVKCKISYDTIKIWKFVDTTIET